MIKFNKDEMQARLAKSLKPVLDATIASNLFVLEKVCESPIEVALGVAIMVADQLEYIYMRNDFILCGPKEIETFRPDINLMVPQFPLDGYRIDFALRLPKYRFKYLLVECDGHDYHERTKEQAARDRSKDRTVQHNGMPILRFTGSEIHADAGACAVEVLNFISERYDDFKPGGW